MTANSHIRQVWSRPAVASLAYLSGLAISTYVLVYLIHWENSFWEFRKIVTESDTPTFFQTFTSVGGLLAFMAFVATRQQSERASYTEINKRYEALTRTILADDELPVGFKQSEINTYIKSGGSRKELLFYDIM